jgi:hypothetical protein
MSTVRLKKRCQAREKNESCAGGAFGARPSGDGARSSQSLYPHPGGFRGHRYLTIAFAMIVPVVMLVISAVMSMLEVTEAGILDTALVVLDSLPLAFIFVELIDTI